MASKRRYDEQLLGPRGIEAGAWYSLPAATRDRINHDYRAVYGVMVQPGLTYIGAVQDVLRQAGRKAAATKFMVAMQAHHDAEAERDKRLGEDLRAALEAPQRIVPAPTEVQGVFGPAQPPILGS
jgi:hypothetical protein